MAIEGLALAPSVDVNLANSIWHCYFPDVEFGVEDRRFRLVAELTDFFSSQQADSILSGVQSDGCLFLPIDFQLLHKVCWVDEFYGYLREMPKDALLCLGFAAHMALLLKGKDYRIEKADKVTIRLYNHLDSMISLKNLKAAYIGKLVSVHGSVVKVSTVKPLVTEMDFLCAKCGTTITRAFPDGKFSPPLGCTIYGCKSRTFTPYKCSAKTIDFQKIRIQELLKSGTYEEGRVPRTVECELTMDLVDSCIPGDIVTVTGIIKVINNYMDIGGGKSRNKNQGLYYLYLEAISIMNSKSQSISEDYNSSSSGTKNNNLWNFHTFSQRDLEFIVKFSEEHGSDIFRQIVQSFCPSIYGHELVKGDPGLGKSQLLQAAAAVSPRGIYVCGNATTNAGLTVAVVKDHMTSDYAFEAGAMVLADRGLCCIDEFDKMSAEHQSLLEAMEQQCVSVAKAGLVASLSARTSVLAAANPIGGHYNRAKTVNENLKMRAALLSRFDLIFILLDKPDEMLDKRVSDHIMALHTGNTEQSFHARKLRRVLESSRNMEFGIKRGLLVSRLRLDQEKDKDFVPLPAPLLRKYISYARAFIFPRMSRPAAEILKKFYLQLRDHNTSSDGTPITARQLESLVRLAEARARLDLREEITAQDAIDVVEIMNESLYDKYVDEHGCVDFARSGGMSKQKEAKRFLSALSNESKKLQKDCFSMSEIESLADKIHLQVPDMEAFVENLNTIGYLLKKGPKAYQVIC
ncbi:hypothetical protein HPP92_019290 [Vanilla planifolia]|uniref:Probable DNA helicase MCM8 n=1 Tax=Vanilla planifolia TaxID=51239 RepID=A0A835Q2L7_VANPL|nr:hypothetical protein HPP92_019290 [Vanilla planifolia]